MTARETFAALVRIYAGQSSDELTFPRFTLKALDTALPMTADLWRPAAWRELPIVPVRRRFGRLWPAWRAYAACVGAFQDARAAVVLIDDLRAPRAFRATVDAFLTLYDSDGYRVGHAYVTAGSSFVLDTAAGYIVNVAIGSVDRGLQGIELHDVGIAGGVPHMPLQ